MADVPFYFIYGVPADTEETPAVHVERVRDRVALHGGNVEAHRHPHLYQLSLWRGGGLYVIENKIHPLPERALTIMPPTVVHGFTIQPPTDAVVVSISVGFVAELKSRMGGDIWPVLETPAIVDLAPEPDRRLGALFAAIEEEYRYRSRHSRSAIACHLQLTAVLIDRLLGLERPESEPGTDDRLLRSFLQLADEKLRERWLIEQYVDALGTTPYLLNRATRRAFGKTAIEVVRDRAVAEAKRLLLFSKAGAGEIGFMLGFEDAAHFGRFFQRRTGLSPSAWRRRHIGRALDGVR